MTDCEWDGESYCMDGCGRPARHERLEGMAYDRPVVELVCCHHAEEARRG